MKKLLFSIASLVAMSASAQTGNVGIGTNNPQYKLDVNGKVRISVIDSSTNNLDKVMVTDSNGVLKFANRSSFLSSEKDSVIGNEVVNATPDRGLVRLGNGTAAVPYTLGFPAGNTNGQIMKWNGSTAKWGLDRDDKAYVNTFPGSLASWCYSDANVDNVIDLGMGTCRCVKINGNYEWYYQGLAYKLSAQPTNTISLPYPFPATNLYYVEGYTVNQNQNTAKPISLLGIDNNSALNGAYGNTVLTNTYVIIGTNYYAIPDNGNVMIKSGTNSNGDYR